MGTTDKTHCTCKNLTCMWKDIVRDCCGRRGQRRTRRGRCRPTSWRQPQRPQPTWARDTPCSSDLSCSWQVTRRAVAWLANPPAGAGAHDIETRFASKARNKGCVTSFGKRGEPLVRMPGATKLASGAHDSGHGIGVRFGSNRKRRQEATSLATDTFHACCVVLTTWAAATGSTAYFSAAERPQTIMQLATTKRPKGNNHQVSYSLPGYQGKNRQPARAAHAVTSQARGGSRNGTGNRPNICAQTDAH